VLRLVPFFCGTRTDLLPELARSLQKVFGLTVQQHPPSFDPETAFDPLRGQYDSRVLLARLLEEAPEHGQRVLGVTTVDLFIPVLTYVFGEAQLDGRAALVSMYRLDATVYGLPEDPGLLAERLRKEAVHELGHTYNLMHCDDPLCVMRSSTYVEEIDLKSDEFCRQCSRSVRPERV
jgi:archaemetzincin